MQQHLEKLFSSGEIFSPKIPMLSLAKAILENTIDSWINQHRSFVDEHSFDESLQQIKIKIDQGDTATADDFFTQWWHHRLTLAERANALFDMFPEPIIGFENYCRSGDFLMMYMQQKKLGPIVAEIPPIPNVPLLRYIMVDEFGHGFIWGAVHLRNASWNMHVGRWYIRPLPEMTPRSVSYSNKS